MLAIDYAKELFAPRKVLRWLVVAIIPSATFYVVSILVMRSSGFGIIEILRDPAQQTDESSFLGFISSIGIWIWVSSGAICLFQGATSKSSNDQRHKELLFLMAAFSFLLAIDDFFLIHDRYIDQNICYLTYALLACLILIRCHRVIVLIDGFAFIAAGSLLALSIITDLVQEQLPLSYELVQVFEEAFKFGGAATWLYFCCLLARHE